jgi:hypothetical protein
MKKNLIAVLTLGLLLAAPALAQTASMKVNVPFDFVVNGKTLPAGEYRVDGLSTSTSTIAIRNTEQSAKLMALTNGCESIEAADASKLVFHRYGSQYFLAQVWSAGSSEGRELPRSRAEREVASNNQPGPQLVAIAALQ